MQLFFFLLEYILSFGLGCFWSLSKYLCEPNMLVQLFFLQLSWLVSVFRKNAIFTLNGLAIVFLFQLKPF